MRLLVLILLLGGSFIGAPASAETRHLGGKGTPAFQLNIPKPWKVFRNVLRIPYVIAGPVRATLRTVVEVTPVGPTTLKWDSEALKKHQAEYEDGRKKWAKKRHFKILSFAPQQSETWASGIDVQIVGVSYQLTESTANELSCYALCKGKLFHFKRISRGPDPMQDSDAQTADGIVRSLRCD